MISEEKIEHLAKRRVKFKKTIAGIWCFMLVIATYVWYVNYLEVTKQFIIETAIPCLFMILMMPSTFFGAIALKFLE